MPCSSYEVYGARSNGVARDTYSCIRQAAARGRLSIAMLIRERTDEELNEAAKTLLPNALGALPKNVETRLVRAQAALLKYPLAIGRRAPLWTHDDEGQKIVAAKIAVTVAKEMALNAQLAEVPGAPQVIEPRFFRPPDVRQVSDFKIGDVVLCSPYVKNKRNENIGLSLGTVCEIITGGKRGARVMVEVEKPSGLKTQYSRSITNRYLIHEPCWRALRHSEALRKSWQKIINTSESDMQWPPLAQ